MWLKHTPYERHIKLPFELKVNDEDFHTKLWDVLPDTLSILEGPGNPFWLHFTFSLLGESGFKICQSFDGTRDAFSDQDLRLIARETSEEISKHNPQIKLIELVFTMEKTFVAVCSNFASVHILTPRLPKLIADCPVAYIGEGHAVAFHNEMRPGSFGSEHVLGNIVHKIPCTDAALVELEGDVIFTNEAILDEKQPPRSKKLTRLFGEDPKDKLEWNTVVRFASPSAATVDGVIAAKSVKLHVNPLCVGEPVRCVVYHWAWTGQVENWSFRPDPVKPGEAMSGTALSDENGVVVGLSHHSCGGRWAGFSVMLSASELVRAGYKLA
ncbi:hypothetical protein FSARC_1039 [Fusarium sarcochroum]|uniref:Uncharacterized protein n=1 Tax=Fusarium sarcochroum TaxID=1208366 RepID=A0A8H4XFD8_9HYPO|nr:hypothetical protein FSARC_1039 [Fusarium sarcochroum]